MADYTYAKKADLYVFQSLCEAVCAKNTKKIGTFKVKPSDHGQSKGVKISTRGKNPSPNFYKSIDKHKKNSHMREFHRTQCGQS